MEYTLKTNLLSKDDLAEFIKCYTPANRNKRRTTFSEKNLDGRWQSFTCDELMARDKVNLDIFWLHDESLEDSAHLPDPDVPVPEFVGALKSALAQFESIAEELGEEE